MNNIIKNIQSINIFSGLDSSLKTELLRKSIHFTIAFVPSLAAWNLGLSIKLLVFGIAFYTYTELLRLQGHKVAIISTITTHAARKRDNSGMVLGPITLGLGALLALSLYPLQAASIAIYALAFGDGFASLIGKFFGSIKLSRNNSKTLEGSLACFFAVLTFAYSLSGSMSKSVIIAIVATVVEALPIKDFDNIAIPTIIGMLALVLGA